MDITSSQFLDRLTGPTRHTCTGYYATPADDRLLRFAGLSTAQMAEITRVATAAQLLTRVSAFAQLDVVGLAR